MSDYGRVPYNADAIKLQVNLLAGSSGGRYYIDTNDPIHPVKRADFLGFPPTGALNGRTYTLNELSREVLSWNTER